MRDNIFASVCENPFRPTEEWFPLLSDNTNSAPGQDLPSLSALRRVSVAAMVFVIQRGPAARPGTTEVSIAADGFGGHCGGDNSTLAHRAADWFLSDPA